MEADRDFHRTLARSRSENPTRVGACIIFTVLVRSSPHGPVACRLIIDVFSCGTRAPTKYAPLAPEDVLDLLL